jgi:homocysteine S-methyltransferase
MRQTADPIAEGVANAAEMMTIARRDFAGACLMPSFDHFEVLFDILEMSSI